METVTLINPRFDFSGEFTMMELAETVKEVSFTLPASPPGYEFAWNNFSLGHIEISTLLHGWLYFQCAGFIVLVFVQTPSS
jgi:hypothetical protein